MHFDWFDDTHHKLAQYKQRGPALSLSKGFTPIVILILVAVLAVGGYFVERFNE